MENGWLKSDNGVKYKKQSSVSLLGSSVTAKGVMAQRLRQTVLQGDI